MEPQPSAKEGGDTAVISRSACAVLTTILGSRLALHCRAAVDEMARICDETEYSRTRGRLQVLLGGRNYAVWRQLEIPPPLASASGGSLCSAQRG
jgi:hypothetical protein